MNREVKLNFSWCLNANTLVQKGTQSMFQLSIRLFNSFGLGAFGYCREAKGRCFCCLELRQSTSPTKTRFLIVRLRHHHLRRLSSRLGRLQVCFCLGLAAISDFASPRFALLLFVIALKSEGETDHWSLIKNSRGSNLKMRCQGIITVRKLF